MEKLPHERLREGGLYNYITDEECSVTACSKCEQFVANKIADEIEKYYIPRPRFEDGELACENDVFVDGLGDEHTISLIEPAFKIWDTDNCFVRYKNLLKRPEPKVLDAEGNEIKVGDTVFENNSPIPLKVVTVYGDGDISAVGDRGICSKLDSSNYSHREPDSLEKLLFELRGVDFIPSKEYLNHIADRLIAIMERDA